MFIRIILIFIMTSCLSKKPSKIYKFGFDLHGVLDKKPEMFSEMTKSLVKSGHKVYVITGLKNDTKLQDELKQLNIYYTDIFSITSYNESIGVKIVYDKEGNPWMDQKIWDKTKAEFCKRENIDLHFDDSKEYLKHFKTSSAFIAIK